MNMVRFGPAGHCDQSAREGAKSTAQLIAYLGKRGLTAFEYQCGRGVRVKEEAARAFAALAEPLDIAISVHAPYYISLASADAQKRENSVGYILQSARAADWLGGSRVVVHPGGLGGLSRPAAMALAAETLQSALKALRDNGLGHIRLCLETMGKINQLGTLEEVLALCGADETLLPCVDFGHLYARTHGAHTGAEAVAATLAAIQNRLGAERMRRTHIHFSHIEYSAGGEVRHLVFSDSRFGPAEKPFLEELARWQTACVVICESAGTQTEDALWMQRYYRRACQNSQGPVSFCVKG